MTKDAIFEYDTIAANNTDVGGVDLAENSMVPSDVNNAFREIMSHLKDVDSGASALSAPDINGGTIDGAVIGGASAAAGTFTTLRSVTNTDGVSGVRVINTSTGGSAYGAIYFGSSSSETDGFIGTVGTNNSAYGGARSMLVGPNTATPLVFISSGVETGRIDAASMAMVNAAGPSLLNEGATSTNPTIIPNKADPDTGMGWVSANIGALVAGGAETLRWSSTSVLPGTDGNDLGSASLRWDMFANYFQADGNATIGTNSGNVLTLNSSTTFGGNISGANAAGPALLNEQATSTNSTLVPNKANPELGIGWISTNTGSLISSSTQVMSWTVSQVSIAGSLASTGTHTVGTNSSGNSATLQQPGGFQFKLNGDTPSQLGVVSWSNNSGATTANLWATGDSSSGGVVRLKGIGHIDLVPGDIGITGAAGYRHSTGVFTPPADNSQTLGSASLRWSTVYAGTGSINTSDERLKQQIKDLDTAELVVAKAIKGMVKKFKFNDAVAEKGDKARIHVGVVAQEVRDAFIAEGLDPTRYSLFCYDEWDEIKEETDEDGTVLVPARPAGNRFGIRYDELLAFIIAAI